jgi:antitoxin VapB
MRRSLQGVNNFASKEHEMNSVYELAMSVNIKNREVESLLAEIKSATGKGTSRIVLELLRSEAARLHRQRNIAQRRRRIERLTKRYSARLPSHPVSPDEIVGYDEVGLPK